MGITPTRLPPAALPVSADTGAVQNRDLARATRSLNQEGTAGPGREFSFSVDPKTRAPIVRIVNSTTGEVIEQIPADYLLKVARNLRELRSTNRESAR